MGNPYFYEDYSGCTQKGNGRIGGQTQLHSNLNNQTSAVSKCNSPVFVDRGVCFCKPFSHNISISYDYLQFGIRV
jgi:hypothetical protein